MLKAIVQRTRLTRLGVAIRCLAIVCVAITCLTITLPIGGAAHAAELPADTATYSYPPYDGPADIRSDAMVTWIQGMQAVAAVEQDPRRRADLLLSAGFALARRSQNDDARTHIVRAAQTYPIDDPFYGPAQVDAARVQLAAGNTAAADEAVQRLESWQLRAPRNATPPVLARVRHAEAYLATAGPAVRINVHVAFARFVDAARAAESLATSEKQATSWHRAAVLWFRAGRLDDALHAADRGIAVAGTESERTLLRAWQLNARHNNLVEGELRLADTWPGDAWNQAALAFVDERAERPLGIDYALMFGSQAFGNKRWAEAIAFYDRALRYPDVIRRTPDLNNPRRFLTGVSTLIRAKQLDAADRLLARLRLVFGNSEPLIDQLSVQVIAQRNAPRPSTPDEPSGSEAGNTEADDTEAADGDPEPARLLVGPERTQPTDEPIVGAEGATPTAAPARWQEPLLWVLVAAALAGVVWAAQSRRRRRDNAGP